MTDAILRFAVPRIEDPAAPSAIGAVSGEHVVVGDVAGRLWWWQLWPGIAFRRWTAHGQQLTAVAGLRDGWRALSADASGTLRLWHTEQAAMVAERELGDAIVALACAPDAGTVAVALRSGPPRLLSLPRLEPVAVLGDTPAQCLRWCGADLWAGHGERLLRWRSGASSPDAEHRASAPVTAIAARPGGRFVCAGLLDGRVLVWRGGASRAQSSIATGAGRLHALWLDRDSKRLHAFGADGIVRSYDRRTGTATWSDRRSLGAQIAAAVTDGGALVGVRGDGRPWLRQLDDAGDADVPERHASFDVAALADDGRLAALDGDGTCRVFAADGRVLVQHGPWAGDPGDLHWTRDGRCVAAMTEGDVIDWAAIARETGDDDEHEPGGQVEVLHAITGQDAAEVAAARERGPHVVLRDALTGAQLADHAFDRVHRRPVLGEDGELVACATDDDLRVLDPRGRVRERFVFAGGAVTAAARDGGLFAALVGYKRLRLWRPGAKRPDVDADAAGWRLHGVVGAAALLRHERHAVARVVTFGADRLLALGPWRVQGIAPAADGGWIVAGDGVLRLYDAALRPVSARAYPAQTTPTERYERLELPDLQLAAAGGRVLLAERDQARVLPLAALLPLPAGVAGDARDADGFADHGDGAGAAVAAALRTARWKPDAQSAAALLPALALRLLDRESARLAHEDAKAAGASPAACWAWRPKQLPQLQRLRACFAAALDAVVELDADSAATLAACYALGAGRLARHLRLPAAASLLAAARRDHATAILDRWLDGLVAPAPARREQLRQAARASAAADQAAQAAAVAVADIDPASPQAQLAARAQVEAERRRAEAAAPPPVADDASRGRVQAIIRATTPYTYHAERRGAVGPGDFRDLATVTNDGVPRRYVRDGCARFTAWGDEAVGEAGWVVPAAPVPGAGRTRVDLVSGERNARSLFEGDGRAVPCHVDLAESFSQRADLDRALEQRPPWLHVRARGALDGSALAGLAQLPGCGITLADATSAGIAAAASLANLRWLAIGSDAGADLAPLARCRTLEVLHVRSSGTLDLRPLRAAPLQGLELDDASALVGLDDLLGLRWLRLPRWSAGGREIDTASIALPPALAGLATPRATTVKDLRRWKPQLASLRWLDLHGKLSADDLRALEACPRLQSLDLSAAGSARRTRLPPLPELTSLTTMLGTANSDIEDTVANTPALTALSLERSSFADAHAIAGWSRLRLLHLGNCEKLRDLGPIAALTSLEWLDIQAFEPRRDLRPLAQLRSLRWLRIGDAQVRNLDALAACERLRWLDIDRDE